MINPLTNSPQLMASGSFLLGNTVPCSGSYLIGKGYNFTGRDVQVKVLQGMAFASGVIEGNIVDGEPMLQAWWHRSWHGGLN
jgi:hypothetical protein